MKRSFTILLVACSVVTFGQNKFAQLGTRLTHAKQSTEQPQERQGTHTTSRKADYEMDDRIDDETQRNL